MILGQIIETDQASIEGSLLGGDAQKPPSHPAVMEKIDRRSMLFGQCLRMREDLFKSWIKRNSKVSNPVRIMPYTSGI